MNALAVQAAAPPAAPPPVAAKSDADSGFSALLNQLHDPKPSTKPAKEEPAVKQDAPDAAPANVMQSLEAALASLAALSSPTAKAVDPQAATPAAPLDQTLAAAANALEANGWDATGRTPLKALLESDPSLGLTDFQMKTFLAAAGATPAKTGATPLGSDSAWSPLEAAKAALAAASPATGDVEAIAQAALPAAKLTAAAATAADLKPHVAREIPPTLASRLGPASSASVDLHGAAGEANPLAAASSAGAASQHDGGDAANSNAAPAAAVQAASTDSPLPLPVTVGFASLPSFIADQAASLAAEANQAAAANSSSAGQTPKAAQAVKELRISLDPGDLGEMTLKLRLTGGKLSVTISVANPSTLSAIEDDRNLITARLASGDQSLEALTIQRQNPTAAAQQEPNASHGFANDSASQDSPSDKRASNGDDRPKPPPRGGAGGAFSDFVV